MKVKSEREVAQSCLILVTPRTVGYQAPPSNGIFQARVLEWGAIAFSVEALYTVTKKKNKEHFPIFSTNVNIALHS